MKNLQVILTIVQKQKDLDLSGINSRIDKMSIERTHHCITSAMEAIVENMYVSQNTTHTKSRYFTSFKEHIIEEKAPIKKSLFKKLWLMYKAQNLPLLNQLRLKLLNLKNTA